MHGVDLEHWQDRWFEKTSDLQNFSMFNEFFYVSF